MHQVSPSRTARRSGGVKLVRIGRYGGVGELMASVRTQGIARIILGAALCLLGLWIARGVLPGLIWALVLLIAVGPLYRQAERRWPPGRHNILLPSLFSLGIGLLVIVPIALVAVQAAHEAHEVAIWVSKARNEGVPVPIWLSRLPFAGPELVSWWQTNLATAQATQSHLHQLDSYALIEQSRLIGSGLLHRLINFAVALVALFLLLRHRDALAEQSLSLGERLFGPTGERIALQMVKSVRGTIDGVVLVGLGEGVLLGIAYAIAGVPHPILLGAITGIAAMIPFGAALLLGFVALLLLAKGATTAALIVVIFGFVVVFVADHAVRPALIGGTTRLPFLWVLIGILGGVESFGLLGLFVGPAVIAALIMLWRDLFDAGLERTHADGRPLG